MKYRIIYHMGHRMPAPDACKKGRLHWIKGIPTIVEENGSHFAMVSIRNLEIVHLPGFGEMVKIQDHSGHAEQVIYLGVALVYNTDGTAVPMDRQTREVAYKLKRRLVEK